ncbi:MAG: dockerin type I domain-containing protein [Candidatus Zixiibacteriota bacterium]
MRKSLIFLFLMVVIATAAYGQDLTSLAFNSALKMDDMELRGDYAFCAMGYGLLVLDVSDFENPTVVANVYGDFDEIREIVLDGNYAYTFSNYYLYIYNITDPINPSYVGSYKFTSTFPFPVIQAITAHDGYLYLSEYTGLIQVLSLANPEAPVSIASKFVGSSIQRTAISDTVLFVSASSGLFTFSISDPADPDSLGFFQYAQGFYDVAVTGTTAIVSVGYEFLLVIDVSNPASPQYITSFTTGMSPYLVEASGNYCYVGDTENGIYCYDITNPASPVQTDVTSYYGFFDIEGDVMAVTWNGIYGVFFDMAVPGDIGDYSRYNCGDYYGSHVIVDGDYAYTAGQHFIVYDITYPGDGMECIGGLYTENAIGLQVSGDYAFIICSDSTVKSIDISGKTAPEFADVAIIPDRLGDLALYGDYLYVSSSTLITILNVSDPTFMTTANTISHSHYFSPLAIEDTLLYHGTVNLYSIADPVNPDLLLDDVVLTFIEDTDIEDGILYGAMAYSEPYIGALGRVDFASPLAPVTLPSFYTPTELLAVEAEAPYVYMIDFTGAIRVVDVSNPLVPDSVTTWSPLSFWNKFQDIEVRGDVSFACYTLGLAAFSTSCLCGDINSDGTVNIGDVTYAVNYIFKGGPPPSCFEAMDVNCDGGYNIGDAVYLIVYIFQGGAPPCAGCE